MRTETPYRKPLHIAAVCGPMAAGKSSALVARAERLALQRQHFVVVKPQADTRSPTITTHPRGLNLKSATLAARTLTAEHTNSLLRGINPFPACDHWLVDECQFLHNPQNLLELLRHCDNPPKTITFYGLDLDANCKPFPATAQILAYASDVTKLKAVCFQCGEDATLTRRLIPWGDSPIGDLRQYTPVCREHWEPPPETA